MSTSDGLSFASYGGSGLSPSSASPGLPHSSNLQHSKGLSFSSYSDLVHSSPPSVQKMSSFGFEFESDFAEDVPCPNMQWERDSTNDTDLEIPQMDCEEDEPNLDAMPRFSGQGCLRRRHRSSKGNGKIDLFTSKNTIKSVVQTPCCGNNCLFKLGPKVVRNIRQYYFGLDGDQQDIYVQGCLRSGSSNKVEYIIGTSIVCRGAFKIVLCLGNPRLKRLRHCLFRVPDLNSPSKPCAPLGQHALLWMDRYFRLHAEVMPTTGCLHLSDNFTKHEVYQAYKDEQVVEEERFVSLSHFLKLWKTNFKNVRIPKKVRMGVCSTYAELKSKKKGASTIEERKMIQAALSYHREQQALERQRAMHHRKKALGSPEKYMMIVIDGMDQKKTNLPHFIRTPKDISEDTFVQIHLVGCLVYNERVHAKVFLTYPNIHNDPNLTITIMQNVIASWESRLPSVLYVQLDNTARENKNSTVFGYLNMLVQMGVFKKVRVNFLLVGHTHDHIDQMFSTFSKKLSRQDAVGMPEMIEVIRSAYTPRPLVMLLQETIDFRQFLSTVDDQKGKCVVQLNDISFQHCFRIKKHSTEDRVCLYGKQYSSCTDWAPSEGICLVLFIPNIEMRAAVQEPLLLPKFSEVEDNVDDDDSGNDEKQRLIKCANLCIHEKQKLIAKAGRYAGGQDMLWWGLFFEHQRHILNRIVSNSWILSEPFQWPTSYNDVARQPEFPLEVQNLLHKEPREMYAGARRSKEKRQALVEMWSGDAQDIKEGMMVATLANGDDMGHSFWIAKVLSLHYDNHIQKLDSITVHWLRTNHQDALKGRYNLEILRLCE